MILKSKQIEILKNDKKELENTIRNLESRINDLKIENGANKGKVDLLEQKLKGERICDTYCKVCENSLGEDYEHYTGFSVQRGKKYTCLLDCKCIDFSKKENYSDE